MHKRLLIAALALTTFADASAQTVQVTGAQPQTPAGPVPYGASPAPAAVLAPSAMLSRGLEAARGRDLTGARYWQGQLTDPVAKKLVDWALLDVMGSQIPAADREWMLNTLQGWPRPEAREDAALPTGPIPYTALNQATVQSPNARWNDARRRMNDALSRGDAQAAYQAVAYHSLTPGGAAYAEAESYAGWLALNKLRNFQAAENHFRRLDAAVKSPTSKARAAYWLGRTYETMGDREKALQWYRQGAQHTTVFYGQLAAEKAGIKQIVLEKDPAISAAERTHMEGNELIRATRLLAGAGERRLVRVFGLHLGDTVQTKVEAAILVDTLKSVGEQEVSLLAYRRAAQRGLILHERGYPVLTPPSVYGGADTPLVLAIIRQESQFDPMVRSSADARGMMQVLPSTARMVARGMGMDFQDSMLWDATSNMRIGSKYLGDLVSQFGGSYAMAVAGYNAGPGRPRNWSEFCGDPRLTHVDPIDFIECIPFAETRNYVMNVMANVQVYRARLNGGTGPLTLAYDLRRGGPYAQASNASGAPL